jgi:hypothetical protein
MDEFEVFRLSLVSSGYSEETAKRIVEIMREKETNYKEGKE